MLRPKSVQPNIPTLAPDLCGRAEQTKHMRKFLLSNLTLTLMVVQGLPNQQQLYTE